MWYPTKYAPLPTYANGSPLSLWAVLAALVGAKKAPWLEAAQVWRIYIDTNKW